MNASTIVALVALVVSTASAIYAYRQGHRGLKVTTYQGATGLTLQLDQVFLAHPELRPYFYEARSTPAAEDDGLLHHRVLAAAEYALDVFECVWDHRDSYEPSDRESWSAWIRDMLASSPACLEIYDANVSWYPALRDLLGPRPDGRDPHAT